MRCLILTFLLFAGTAFSDDSVGPWRVNRFRVHGVVAYDDFRNTSLSGEIAWAPAVRLFSFLDVGLIGEVGPFKGLYTYFLNTELGPFAALNLLDAATFETGVAAQYWLPGGVMGIVWSVRLLVEWPFEWSWFKIRRVYASYTSHLISVGATVNQLGIGVEVKL